MLKKEESFLERFKALEKQSTWVDNGKNCIAEDFHSINLEILNCALHSEKYYNVEKYDITLNDVSYAICKDYNISIGCNWSASGTQDIATTKNFINMLDYANYLAEHYKYNSCVCGIAYNVNGNFEALKEYRREALELVRSGKLNIAFLLK